MTTRIAVILLPVNSIFPSFSSNRLRELAQNEQHIDWIISCRLMQSTIMKPLVGGSGDTITAQTLIFSFAELPCWVHSGILSIAEMLEDKYIVYKAPDILEESPRYGCCWLSRRRHELSSLGRVRLF
jgi:hypothetical protein